MLNTPVALCIFNRPAVTEQVFAAIADARPKQLFIFADGPRNADDVALCERTRAIVGAVDWECEVKQEFALKNQSTRRRIPSGLDWVFAHVDQAIFLEDDCLPDPSFFRFCEQALQRYRDDERVMMVSGSNYLQQWKADVQSYHFSLFGSPWGWATWKRAWQCFADPIPAWTDPAVRSQVRDLIDDDEAFAFQARRFDDANNDLTLSSPWDVQWNLSRLLRGGVSVVPARNLIRNLGNAEGRGLPDQHPLARLTSSTISFPLVAPAELGVDREYDRRHVRQQYDWWRQLPATEGSSSDAPLFARLRRRLRGRRGSAAS